MKPIIQLTLAAAAGIFIGAGATTLMAQTAEPKAYMVANTYEIKDPATFKTYQDKAGATQGPYGGRVIARGPAQALDSQTGAWATATPPKGNMLLVEFPSMAKLQAFWHSPEYSAIRPIREQSTNGASYIVMGVPPG